MILHTQLDSILVALVVGFREIALEVEDDQGLNEESLRLRIGDMQALFNEAVSTIHKMDVEASKPEDYR